jgi:class 3 adenylate cyclase
LLFNQTAERIFGLCEDEVVGKHVSLIPGLSSLNDLFDQAMRGPVGRDIVLDEKRILYASVSPIIGTGYIAVLQDVTERIKMERREREELREIFGRYVSPSLLDHAIHGDTDIFAHQKRWAIVLFADLRNNTEMVVNLPASEALSLLNEIFDDLMEIIFANQGTVLDLIGDELEVTFNVPFDQPDAVARALKTAIEMQERFNERQAEWSERSGVKIGLGIGIDQGEVVIGNVGSHRRMNLALVGEAVNTAHRLVDLAEDGQIVVSESFYREIESADTEFTPIRDIYIKGKPETTVVYCANQRKLAVA